MRLKRKLSDQEIDRFYTWLHTTPGYRELIRQRISDEQKRRRKREFQLATREKALRTRYGKTKHSGSFDHDDLGREVDGCG